MRVLAKNPALREKLGRNGRVFVEENHTYEAHRKRLNSAYDWIEQHLQVKE
jgi:hypothetical protein